MWHISTAKYNKKDNGVQEFRHSNFLDYYTGLTELEKISKPAYLWNDKSAESPCYAFSVVENIAYQMEYKKIID